jgi:hypothetical protein
MAQVTRARTENFNQEDYKRPIKIGQYLQNRLAPARRDQPVVLFVVVYDLAYEPVYSGK